jgi:hypothetical protein
MANDHYISRFLTKPWEVGQRQLWFYDFETDRFDWQSSESLFAAEGLHSKETGDRLNQLIETPVSRYRAATLAGGEFAIGPDKDWKLFRALVALLRLQPQRHADKEREPDRKFTLDNLIAGGENFLDYMASEINKDYVLIGATLRNGAYEMCFTDAVYFPIPMIGSEPILAVPLTPGHFIALPRKSYQKRALEDWLASESSMSAFSVGLGGTAKKVVVPPGLQSAIRGDPAGLGASFRELRINCRQQFNIIGKANATLGFPSFFYSEDDEDPMGPRHQVLRSRPVRTS